MKMLIANSGLQWVSVMQTQDICRLVVDVVAKSAVLNLGEYTFLRLVVCCALTDLYKHNIARTHTNLYLLASCTLIGILTLELGSSSRELLQFRVVDIRNTHVC